MFFGSYVYSAMLSFASSGRVEELSCRFMPFDITNLTEFLESMVSFDLSSKTNVLDHLVNTEAHKVILVSHEDLATRCSTEFRELKCSTSLTMCNIRMLQIYIESIYT